MDNRKNNKKPICMQNNMHDNINVEFTPAVEVTSFYGKLILTEIFPSVHET
jgi:hypothetical protein